VLNLPRYQGASVLLARKNFGCGSSREHAPQSLRKYGFDAVIAESFAEIFFGNSTTLAMPCVVATAEDIVALKRAVEADPTVEVTIDLDSMRVRSSAGSVVARKSAGTRQQAMTMPAAKKDRPRYAPLRRPSSTRFRCG
jgi:3-isopropylmalate/(R)-2-methylmalate dehydratase small subunit